MHGDFTFSVGIGLQKMFMYAYVICYIELMQVSCGCTMNTQKCLEPWTSESSAVLHAVLLHKMAIDWLNRNIQEGIGRRTNDIGVSWEVRAISAKPLLSVAQFLLPDYISVTPFESRLKNHELFPLGWDPPFRTCYPGLTTFIHAKENSAPSSSDLAVTLHSLGSIQLPKP